MKKRLKHLPAGLLASVVVLLVAAPVGWLVHAGAGALGAAAGVALVVLSFVVSSLVVAWVDLVARHLMLPIVLLTYALKFTLLGVVMFRVAEVGWAGLPVMGFTVIAATIAWTGAQLYWILNAKILYVETE